MGKLKKISMSKSTIFLMLLVALIGLSGCSSANKTKQNSKQVSKNISVDTDSDKDGIPNNAEIVLGTDPQNQDTDGDGINDKTDKNPTLVEGSFIKSAGASDFSIEKILVENNVDPSTNKGTPDHLEIFLKNNSQKIIKDFSIYYEYKDLEDNSKQSYEIFLTGFMLNPNQRKSVHIDTSGKAGHFRANPNSSYYQSINPKDITVIVSADGHQVQEMTVKKDKGGAEIAD